MEIPVRKGDVQIMKIRIIIKGEGNIAQVPTGFPITLREN